MRLYNGMSPNGARVSIFLAEKGVEIETQDINIMAGETRGDEFAKINSLGQVPVLEFDDGERIAESVAICRYLESVYPEPSLLGKTAKEQARIEMWSRRIELNVFNVIGDAGRHEIPLFKDVVEQNAEFAAAKRREFAKKLVWLNAEMEDGRPYFAGASFSIADITGMAMLLLFAFANASIPADLLNLKRWEESVRSRSSFPALPA